MRSLIDCNQKPIFIKCDIEGGEMKLITQDFLSRTLGRIKEWVVEVHPTTGFSQQRNLEIIRKLFLNNGYLVNQLNHETLYANFTR